MGLAKFAFALTEGAEFTYHRGFPASFGTAEGTVQGRDV